MCNNKNEINNIDDHGVATEFISNSDENIESTGNQGQILSSPDESDESTGNQEAILIDKSNQNTDGKDADTDLKKEQKQKQNSYNVSFWLTIIVIVTWIIVMVIIACKINCIIVSPNGWHILLFSISLLLIAFSLSGRLFRRFYPSSKSDKDEFNLHEALTKLFDKLVDKLPELLKGNK